MVVGVNGVGKTTTIGKLAYQFKQKGLSVYLGAADTFRAAAGTTRYMGQRVGVPVVKQKMGLTRARGLRCSQLGKAHGADVVIIDTADVCITK